MKHLKKFEIKSYKYTLDEVMYKIFGDEYNLESINPPKLYKQIHNTKIKDENLYYLINEYVKYKSKHKKTNLLSFTITKYNLYINFLYYENNEWWSDSLYVFIRKPNFIDFINDPDLYKKSRKFNL